MSFIARFSFIFFPLQFNKKKLVQDFYLSITLVAFTYRTIKQFKPIKYNKRNNFNLISICSQSMLYKTFLCLFLIKILNQSWNVKSEVVKNKMLLK